MDASRPLPFSPTKLSSRRLTAVAAGKEDCTKLKGSDVLSNLITGKEQALELLKELHEQSSDANNYIDTLNKINQLQSLMTNPLELYATRAENGIRFTWKIDIPVSTNTSLTEALSSTDFQSFAYSSMFGCGPELTSYSGSSNLNYSYDFQAQYHQGSSGFQSSRTSTKEPSKIEHSFTVSLNILVRDFNSLLPEHQVLLTKHHSEYFGKNIATIINGEPDTIQKLIKLTILEVITGQPLIAKLSLNPAQDGMLVSLPFDFDPLPIYFTLSLKDLFKSFDQLSTELQKRLLEKIATEPVFLIYGAQHILGNFQRFSSEQQKNINKNLLMDPTLNPEATLGRLDAFDMEMRDKIIAAFAKEAKKNAASVLKNFKCFVKDTQSTILKDLAEDVDFIKKNITLLIQHRRLFDNVQFELILKKALRGFDFKAGAEFILQNAALFLQFKRLFKETQIHSILQVLLDSLDFKNNVLVSTERLETLCIHQKSLDKQQKTTLRRQICTASPDFIKKNAERLLQSREIFEAAQIEYIFNVLLDSLDFEIKDPDLAQQLKLLFTHSNDLSAGQKESLRLKIFKAPRFIKENAILLLLNKEIFEPQQIEFILQLLLDSLDFENNLKASVEQLNILFAHQVNLFEEQKAALSSKIVEANPDFIRQNETLLFKQFPQPPQSLQSQHSAHKSFFDQKQIQAILQVSLNDLDFSKAVLNSKGQLLWVGKLAVLFPHHMHFSEEQRKEFQDRIFKNGVDFIKENADSLLQYKQLFATSTVTIILQVLLQHLDFAKSVSTSLSYLAVLFTHHDSLTEDQQVSLLRILYKEINCILQSDVDLILKYLHLFPKEEDRNKIMSFIMEGKVQKKSLSNIIEDCAGSILLNYASLTKNDCKKIDGLFPTAEIAKTCGVTEGTIPEMSTKEKLLSLALIGFHKKYADNTDVITHAYSDPEMNQLMYAVYRPQESRGQPPVINIEKYFPLDVQKQLKVLNGNEFDVTTVFTKVGYEQETETVTFSYVHPLAGTLFQNNPLQQVFDLILGTMLSIQAKFNEIYNRQLIIYQYFYQNLQKYQDLLLVIYRAHSNTLTISNGKWCRNYLS